MLRLKILASVVPLVAAALFARGDVVQCPALHRDRRRTVSRSPPLPWQAHSHVGFTHDPDRATCGSRLSDSAKPPIAVIDDVDTRGAGACEGNPRPRYVAISYKSLAEWSP